MTRMSRTPAREVPSHWHVVLVLLRSRDRAAATGTVPGRAMCSNHPSQSYEFESQASGDGPWLVPHPRPIT